MKTNLSWVATLMPCSLRPHTQWTLFCPGGLHHIQTHVLPFGTGWLYQQRKATMLSNNLSRWLAYSEGRKRYKGLQGVEVWVEWRVTHGFHPGDWRLRFKCVIARRGLAHTAAAVLMWHVKHLSSLFSLWTLRPKDVLSWLQRLSMIMQTLVFCLWTSSGTERRSRSLLKMWTSRPSSFRPSTSGTFLRM